MGRGRWLWPDVTEQEGALKAIKDAWQAAFFVAAVTALIGGLAIALHQPVAGFGGWALVVACFMALIGWRITKQSRAWAVVALIYWAVNMLAKVFSGSATGAFGVVTILVLMAFVSGVRGTFAIQRLRNAAASEVAVAPQ